MNRLIGIVFLAVGGIVAARLQNGNAFGLLAVTIVIFYGLILVANRTP